jgi:two-component system LytT family response regulator
MSRLRALIVDDEALARQRLADLLAEAPDIELVASSANGPDAVERILALQPDLVFLDVQMPEMSGFEVLDAVGVASIPALVFVTAHDAYALRAFESRALDYLLKPFTAARFVEALQRARRVLSGDAAIEQHRRTDELLAALLPPPAERRIAARDGQRIVFLQAREIDWIEGAGNYVRLRARGSAYRLRATLKQTAERLRAAGFRRISHSVIVNLDRVRAAERRPDGDYELVLGDGTRLTTSRSYAGGIVDLTNG